MKVWKEVFNEFRRLIANEVLYLAICILPKEKPEDLELLRALLKFWEPPIVTGNE